MCTRRFIRFSCEVVTFETHQSDDVESFSVPGLGQRHGPGVHSQRQERYDS